MSELKPYKTYQEQIELLKSRGCIIEDDNYAKEKLEHIGYYRLSAYFLAEKCADNTYRDGTSFNKAIKLYEFDSELRNQLFKALEIIEISFRARLAYFHGGKYGALGYLDSANFNAKHKVLKFNANLQREIENNKKVSFVKHHLDNYNGQFPIWVICELFTFGMMSCFYNDLTTADKKQFIGSAQSDTVSWLRCCTDLRNICAHYGRIYNRIFTAMPTGVNGDENSKRRFWGAIQAVKELYPNIDEWNNRVIPSIKSIFDKYSEYIDLNCLAFPQDWYETLTK